MSLPARVVCVSGIDGSGKSMLIEALVEAAKARGEKVDVQWLRFNHFYVKPLLALGRLFRLTVYEEVEGHRLGYHRFGRPWIIKRLYYWLQLLDARRATRRFLSRSALEHFDLIVLDRFVFDIVADMCVATDDPSFLDSPYAQRFLDLLPKGALVLGLQRNREGILECRPESGFDRDFEPRLALYERICQRPDVVRLENNGSPGDLLNAASSLT